MSKPSEFHEIYVLNTDVPYNGADKSAGGTFSSVGTLHAGRVVWLQTSVAPGQKVAAYAEGVGVVTLASDCLQKAS